ncbi:alpha/beta hydrolase [Streptomyces sp. 2A115]
MVFVHGLWLHSTSWRLWIDLFREEGYAPSAHGWPGDPDTVEEARQNPESIAGYGIDDVVEHYAALIAALPVRPIVIGHSFGGMIAQKLLGQDRAAAAIAIDAAQIKGVLPLPLSALRATFPVLEFFAGRVQIRQVAVQDQVDEQPVVNPASEGTQKVVLGVQSDQDVLDPPGFVAQLSERREVHAYDIGVSLSGFLKVETCRVADGAERHATDVVDDRGAQYTFDTHRTAQGALDRGHSLLPRRVQALCRPDFPALQDRPPPFCRRRRAAPPKHRVIIPSRLSPVWSASLGYRSR